jgi:CRP-like cAMP-binding protein
MSIEDDISLFERVPTLGTLGRQALRILAIGAETRYIHGGEVLFSAGEESDCAFVIQEGRFGLSAGGYNEPLTVGQLALLGEVALLTGTKRPVTATALEPSTVLCIPRPLFLKMLESFPEDARKLRDLMASRLDQTTDEINGISALLQAYDAKTP